MARSLGGVIGAAQASRIWFRQARWDRESLLCFQLNKITPHEHFWRRKKIPAGILGILIGALGIHKFYLGYTKEGLIMLLVTVLTLGFGGFIMGIIGLIEGIVYLTKPDDQFAAT